MYPTLLRIGSIRIDTYSVIWFIALSLAIVWSIRRLDTYHLDEYEARKVMAVSFFCMLLGARSFDYIVHWRTYMANPSFFLDLNRGGLHEFGAVSGAFLSAWAMCLLSRGKVSFLKLCDVAVIPAFLAIAVGRWGCFMNGCCIGLTSKAFCAVHFPRDRAGVLRHPVQVYYSVLALVIVLLLLWTERRTLKLQQKQERYYSVLAPLGIILYVLMRYAVVPFRDRPPLRWMIEHTMTYKGATWALVFACVWLAYSLLRLKAYSSHKQNKS